MYDSGGQVNGGGGGNPNDMKKLPGNNNNNQPNAINHNAPLALRPRHLPQYQHPELDELTGQEISLDLQHLIEDQFRDQEGLALLQEILPGGRANPQNGVFPRTTLSYMPQGVHQGAYPPDPPSDSASVKEEPQEPHDYRRQCQQIGPLPLPPAPFVSAPPFPTGGSYATNGAGGSFLPPGAPQHLALKHKSLHAHNHGHNNNHNSRRHAGKALDKGTDEYRRRRERNNIAVRKSREKAKVRSREVEEKVKCLIREKDSLVKRLEAMSGELSLHKQMYVHLMNLNHPEINDLCRSMLNLGSGPDHPM